MPAKMRLIAMLRFMFAAIVSRKLWSTARLKPALATAGTS